MSSLQWYNGVLHYFRKIMALTSKLKLCAKLNSCKLCSFKSFFIHMNGLVSEIHYIFLYLIEDKLNWFISTTFPEKYGAFTKNFLCISWFNLYKWFAVPYILHTLMYLIENKLLIQFLAVYFLPPSKISDCTRWLNEFSFLSSN